MGVFLLLALLLVHGGIHLLGFAKSRGWSDPERRLPAISRGWGWVWGATGLLWLSAAAAALGKLSWWWLPAAAALPASQLVIVKFWKQARWGSLANLLLVLPIAGGFGGWRFERRVAADLAQLRAREPVRGAEVVEAGALEGLPSPVAAWLRRAGVVGQPRPTRLHLRQRGSLQTAPESAWLSFEAEQWLGTAQPAFLWVARVESGWGVPLLGCDRMWDGEGLMAIELAGLLTVAEARGPKVDQSSLQRFLAEMMWFPAAVLEPYVRWEPLDARAARAVIRSGELEALGVFHFDAEGDVVRFEARRYRDESLEHWIVENDPGGFVERDGIRIPGRSTVSWRDAAGELWTWLRLEVVALERDGG